MKILLFLLFPLLSFCQDTAKTIKAGRYSSPAIWANKKVPSKVPVVINHAVTVDISTEVKGIVVNKSLTFDRSRNVTIQCDGNFIVRGELTAAPATPSISHVIRFINVNENEYIGGGMEIIDCDKGYWGEGINSKTTLKGSPKTPWTNLIGAAYAGDSIIRVQKATNWRIGDEVVITATAHRSTPNFYLLFDRRKIKKVTGNAILLDSALSYDHPTVFDQFNNKTYTAEVLNLSRNVRIEGTPTGRAHVIFLMAGKQTIEYAWFRWLGPRRGVPGNSTDVLGRYSGIHFHHCDKGSAGSLLYGVSVSDGGSNAYVPHGSDSIRIVNSIAHDITGHGVWWDFPEDNSTMSSNNSNYITLDSMVVSYVKADPPQRGYRLGGYVLGVGENNSITNCIATGITGTKGSAGYIAPEASNYMRFKWVNRYNRSHNIRNDGFFNWKNDSTSHLVQYFLSYNGETGIEHGAYHNGYRYQNVTLLNHNYGALIHATAIPNAAPDSNGYRSSFTNVNSTDPLYITVHTLPGTETLFNNCYFPKVIVNELPARVQNPPGALYDFVNCRLQPEQFEIIGMEKGSRLRVQDDRAYEITADGVVSIDNFFK